MANENGEWIMRGVDRDDPARLKTVDEALAYIESVGFLPLFANGIRGFSLEEHTYGPDWWSDDPARDPWIWRQLLAGGGKIAYGKFYDKRAGFVSLKRFPAFANGARDGYDFDARVDDELASRRQKKIMDCFSDAAELMSYELKRRAGFSAGGEKNFEGTLTSLEGMTYLAVKEFRQKRNKFGQPYGWFIAVYAPPEAIFGEELVTRDYVEDPALSRAECVRCVKERFPKAAEKEIAALLFPNDTAEFL